MADQRTPQPDGAQEQRQESRLYQVFKFQRTVRASEEVARLSLSAYRVLGELLEHVQPDGSTWYTYQSLVDDVGEQEGRKGICERTIRKALAELYTCGLLTYEGAGKSIRNFRVLAPRVVKLRRRERGKNFSRHVQDFSTNSEKSYPPALYGSCDSDPTPGSHRATRACEGTRLPAREEPPATPGEERHSPSARMQPPTGISEALVGGGGGVGSHRPGPATPANIEPELPSEAPQTVVESGSPPAHLEAELIERLRRLARCSPDKGVVWGNFATCENDRLRYVITGVEQLIRAGGKTSNPVGLVKHRYDANFQPVQMGFDLPPGPPKNPPPASTRWALELSTGELFRVALEGERVTLYRPNDVRRTYGSAALPASWPGYEWSSTRPDGEPDGEEADGNHADEGPEGVPIAAPAAAAAEGPGDVDVDDVRTRIRNVKLLAIAELAEAQGMDAARVHKQLRLNRLTWDEWEAFALLHGITLAAAATAPAVDWGAQDTEQAQTQEVRA